MIYYDGEDDIIELSNRNDIIQKDTLHLVVNKEYEVSFRAKDVIHSAYFLHLRAQMNTVPGLTTEFVFTPKYTTEEMYQVAASEGKRFTGYILYCNKICGASHYNMKLKINVVEDDVYKSWLAQQQDFVEAFK